jgi:hypothetical protein
MIERRALERFSLEIPARVQVFSTKTKQPFDLLSSNISAGGVFFPTFVRVKPGTRVRITFRIPSKIIQRLTGTQSVIRVEGVIVRSDPRGTAISFDRNYQISPNGMVENI